MWNDLRNEPAESGTTAGNDQAGLLCRFDPDGSYHATGRGFGCPNTFAWSLDERTFYTADSATGVLYAYRFDADAGTISEPRRFAAPADLGVPDGSAVDAEGCLWNARWGAGCVARFAPDGRLLDVFPIPADHVTSCAFGGRNLETLFVTSARVGLSERRLVAQPTAGGVFAFNPDVPGVARAEFADSPDSADAFTPSAEVVRAPPCR
jgi:sugar lactone lactonase YvrE